MVLKKRKNPLSCSEINRLELISHSELGFTWWSLIRFWLDHVWLWEIFVLPFCVELLRLEDYPTLVKRLGNSIAGPLFWERNWGVLGPWSISLNGLQWPMAQVSNVAHFALSSLVLQTTLEWDNTLNHDTHVRPIENGLSLRIRFSEFRKDPKEKKRLLFQFPIHRPRPKLLPKLKPMGLQNCSFGHF